MKFQRDYRMLENRFRSSLQKKIGEILTISVSVLLLIMKQDLVIFQLKCCIRLADYYDTTIDYLVGRTDNKEPIK